MSEWTETETSGGGSGDRYVSETPPSNPGKNDEWVDTSFETPAIKFYDGDKFITASEGSNVPATQSYTGDAQDQIDVSDINEQVTVIVAGEGSSRPGGYIVADVDLSAYGTLEVYSGTYKEGESAYSATDGGDSSAIVADGDLIVGAGGGGGSHDRVDGYTDRYNAGGNGGGPAGGRGGTSPDQGPNAGGTVTRGDYTVEKNTKQVYDPKVELFVASV